MLKTALAFCAAACFVTHANGATIQQRISEKTCGTYVVAGLSVQLVQEANCLLNRTLFSDLRGLSNVALTDAVKAVPFAQTPVVSALAKAANARGSTITINSALRTLPQQLLLYKWSDAYGTGGCGITVAALPGNSNHNGGLALDVADPYGWKSTLEAHGFRHLGSGDPPHFDYISGGEDVRSVSVKAFQSLWNRNNPTDLLTVDGGYGPKTESKVLQSPAEGFPLGATCTTNIDPNACVLASGAKGTCKDEATCTGTSTPNLCPGTPANIKCCVVGSTAAPPTPPPTPIAATEKCKIQYGATASCGVAASCTANVPEAGLCTGATEIQCCPNFQLANAFQFYDPVTSPHQLSALNFLAEKKLKYMPNDFSAFACIFRNILANATEWKLEHGTCGCEFVFSQAALYYSGAPHQILALDMLQQAILKTSDATQFRQFIRIYRGLEAAPGVSTPPSSAPASGGGNTGGGSCTKRTPTEHTLNNNGLELITHFEGFYSSCYLDTEGIWTIGYGHACHVNSNDGSGCGVGGTCSGSITRAKAKEILDRDMAKFTKCVRDNVKVPLTSNQFGALVSFAFNVGCGGFGGSTLLKLLNAGSLTPQAAQYQFSRWHSGCTNGLKRRRFAEAELFNSCEDTFPCSYASCQLSYGYDKCKTNCQYCTVCSGCAADTTSRVDVSGYVASVTPNAAPMISAAEKNCSFSLPKGFVSGIDDADTWTTNFTGNEPTSTNDTKAAQRGFGSSLLSTLLLLVIAGVMQRIA